MALPSPLPGSQPVTGEGASFQGALDAFLRKWSLASLTTWDLPLPQGPLIPSPLPTNSAANAFDAVWIAIPLHYPLLGNDAFLEEVRAEQLDVAAAKGLDMSAAALSHHVRYGTIFDVQHWEQVLTQRLESLKIKDIVTVVVSILADYLGISEDEIRKLRKMISRCRRGERHQIKALQGTR